MSDLNAALREEIRSICNRVECNPDALADDILAAILTVLDEGVGWRDEWQVMHRHYGSVDECGACWSTCGTEEEARRDAAQAVSEGTWGEVWIARRRVAKTAWERVPNA